MSEQQSVTGPDLEAGIDIDLVPDGTTLAGHVGDQPVLMSRRGADWFAVGGACTHYGGSLASGLIDGDTVHCPLHHACFSLRNGEALAAPAFDALPCWRVDVAGRRVSVRHRIAAEPMAPARDAKHPGRIVIVGGGAAGFAAAEMLRRRGFAGSLVMLSSDKSPPCDRPNLSKDYLAGTAPEDWIPLKGDDFYRARDIDLRLGVEVSAIDRGRREVTAAGGRIPYDALLLATGASPIRLSTPGFDLPNVHVLRSLADARAIIAAVDLPPPGKSSAPKRTVAVIGASFIGLEVAAALRARDLNVHVIAPEEVPLQRVLGPAIGSYVRGLHEAHGVRFHLGATATAFDGRTLRLSDDSETAADLVVLGVGVRPNIQLAASAGLAVDKGVVVDRDMRTSDPAIFAAGDIALYRDPGTNEPIRIEHWVAAERQGQAAAIGMLEGKGPVSAAPFFWSVHYEQAIRYVGHASAWDDIRIDGSIEAGDFTARYFKAGRLLAAASLNRDAESLEIQVAMDKAAHNAKAPG